VQGTEDGEDDEEATTGRRGEGKGQGRNDGRARG